MPVRQSASAHIGRTLLQRAATEGRPYDSKIALKINEFAEFFQARNFSVQVSLPNSLKKLYITYHPSHSSRGSGLLRG